MEKHIVKRKGHSEAYDEKKVYGSVYAAAVIASHGEKRAEQLAAKVMKAVNSWAKKAWKKKKAINSKDIREQVLKHLKDRETQIIYRHHRDLC